MDKNTRRRLWGGFFLAVILVAAGVGIAQVAFFQRVILGSCQLSTGSGPPEGAVTGSVCDVFLRTDGTTGTTFYVKESGTATNTGWISTSLSYSYGELYSTAVPSSPFTFALDADTGTFEQITDATIVAGNANLMTVNGTTDTITVAKTSTFDVSFNVSFIGALAGTDRIHFRLYRQGSPLANCETVQDSTSASDYASAAFTCVATGTAGDVFDVRANNATDGTDILIAVFNLNMSRIGG